MGEVGGAAAGGLRAGGQDLSVSLVFVSTDEAHVLVPALESLYEEHPRHDFEIVVVDNASTDGVADRVIGRWPGVKVLTRDRRYGLPSNLNHGIRNSKGDYVMLCNSDLVFRRGSVDKLKWFLDDHSGAGIVAPKLMSPNFETRVSARRWYTWFVLAALKGPWRRLTSRSKPVRDSMYEEWDYSDAKQVDWVPCPATMVRRTALDQVGLMDERFRLYFDDVDICLRMHKAGWEVWCEPAAEVIHLEQRASVRPFSRAWRWHLISLLKFWAKHKGLHP